MPLDPDLGKRPPLGVVVSLLDIGDGTCRLILDDVRNDQPRRETSWQFSAFYTHKRLDSQQVHAMSLPAGELQALGQAILARLVALSH